MTDNRSLFFPSAGLCSLISFGVSNIPLISLLPASLSLTSVANYKEKKEKKLRNSRKAN